jgi:hypothetical protein
MARHAQLAHEEHVQRRPERLCDLKGDRDAASRERQDDHIVAAGVLAQALREQPTRLSAVPEGRGGHHEFR